MSNPNERPVKPKPQSPGDKWTLYRNRTTGERRYFREGAAAGEWVKAEK